MQPVTVSDVAALLLGVFEVFMPFGKMLFSMMLAFYLAFGIRKLLVGDYH